MMIDVSIIDGPLPPDDLRRGDSCADAEVAGRVGARVCFDGIVREVEDGRRLIALEYQAYEPMAGNQLRELAADVGRKHKLIGVSVRHSRGRVHVGEVSFRLIVLGSHRKESLAATNEFIERMKKDVPIWKAAVFAESP